MTALPENLERQAELVPVPGVVAGAPRVLLFGGSFDPIHRGHAALPFDVVEAMGWDDAWVVFVPAARSPHKDDQPAPDRHRVEMIRLALNGRERWWIWEQEIRDAARNPGQPSYWADTWSIARSVFTPLERAFLIGADQALSMHRWHKYESFWRDAVVMLRGASGSVDELMNGLREVDVWSPDDLNHWRSRLVETDTIKASSTDIRAAARAEGLQRENPRVDGVDPWVWRYLVERGLYRAADGDC